MSVNPGFGGQSYIPSSYAKVRQVKSLLGRRPIEIWVDGGVNPDKAGPLAQAGADILVAGSAIFGAQDPAQAVKDLRSASEVLKYPLVFPEGSRASRTPSSPVSASARR